MDSENQMDVTGPLKHLLSIEWDNGIEVPLAHKTGKQSKKVRFADQLEHLKIIDFDAEDRIGCDEGDRNENDGPILGNSLQCECEDEITVNPEDGIISDICEQLTDVMYVGLSQSTNALPLGTSNESAAAYKNLGLHSADVDGIDADFKTWRAPDESKRTRLWKMAVKKSSTRKQSSKINSLLEKNNLTHPRAAELQKAIFQAWCEVKNEQKIRKTEKNISSTLKNSEKEEKTASDYAFRRWKKSKRAQRRMNESKKVDSDSSTDTVSQLDKEESEAVFKMWKKKKDALLMKRKVEGSRLEQEENVNSLMNAELRKEEAELAYAAWKYHKYGVLQKEKQKQEWMQRKERENEFIQHKRNEEALHVYVEWLEKKKYLESCAKQEKTFAQDPIQKVPWYPPNKS